MNIYSSKACSKLQILVLCKMSPLSFNIDLFNWRNLLKVFSLIIFEFLYLDLLMVGFSHNPINCLELNLEYYRFRDLLDV